MKKLRNWFLSGIVAILPIGVTVFVLIWLFQLLDNLLEAPVYMVFGRDIPGIGLLAILIIVLITGMITSSLFGRKRARWLHHLLEKIPIVSTVYKPVSKIAASFSSGNSKSFKSVVAVEFPSEGITSIGFIINDNVAFGGNGKVCVFIPTTPNPTNGFLVFVEKSKARKLDVSVSEGLNMVVSIGSVVPPNVPYQDEPEGRAEAEGEDIGDA